MMIREMFDRLSINLTDDIYNLLDNHIINQKNSDYYLSVMNEEDIIEIIDFMSSTEVYQNIVPLWTDENSNYVGIYYNDPLQYRICYINHEETDISPGFRSVNTFLSELENNPGLDWNELSKDYPAGREIISEHAEDDRKCLKELDHILESTELDDELRCQIIFCVMALTTYSDLDKLLTYLDDDDMYVQERACEILGFHRYEPASEKLREVVEHGMHNGKQAAKRALSRIRDKY